MEEPIPDSQPNNAMVDTNNKDDQATRSEAEHSTQESPSKAAEETVPDSQPSIDIVDTNNNEFGEDGDKLSLIKLAKIIEVSAKKGTRDLKLQGKLIGCLIL
ncbi:hypothetical protein MTR_7g405810 [Medicago truncatula]|uniref:Uncharacterized protein n=1 Tax=Medicago truncatula TaxID=3880 RepID=A0A072TX80_MEDTR|nr:hypothetical protein MTR_7g405810 [Medicago truncatula]